MADPKVKAKFTRTDLPKNFFSAFQKEVLVLANETNRKLAQDLAEEAKNIIRRQRFNWVALDPVYERYKEKHGLDKRILMATKDYVNNGIGWWEEKGLIFVGPKKGIHEPSGLTYIKLARIHEFGTWFIPARPLYRPLLSIGLKKKPKLAKEYAEGVRLAFKRRAKAKQKITK